MKSKVLSIDYYDEFKCIGNECEDHCCKGWKITVDKSTYNKYKKLKASEFKKKLDNNINRNRKSIDDYDYAKINLIDEKCPMLDENRLCNVYKNLGEQNMCYTCRTYPRIYNKVDDILEKSLTLSCEEVARNLLLRRNPIEFNLDIKEVEDIKIVETLKTNNATNIRKKYFNEIRAFSIEIIQERKLNIENRMIILGLFINELYKNEKEKNIVENTINKYANRISKGYYNNLSECLIKEENINAQLEFLINIYRVITNKRIISKRYLDNFIKIINFFKLESENPILIRDRYINANNYYKNFMKEYEYIYENYLVTYMFKNMFPMNEHTLIKSYINIVVQFSILKMNLIGVCGHYKENMDEKKVVNLIQSYSAITEHDQVLSEKIQIYLSDNKLDTLAHMIILVGK